MYPQVAKDVYIYILNIIIYRVERDVFFDLGVGQYILGPPTLTINWQDYNTHDKPVLFQVNSEVTLKVL